MKKAFRILMAAFVLTATFGLTACDPDEEKPTPTPEPTPEPIENYEPSSTYALYVGDTEIPVGDTCTYTATDDDLNYDEVVVNFIIENKTTGPVSTSRAVTVFVTSSRRSANVLLPWSIWAMIQKLRMFFIGL